MSAERSPFELALKVLRREKEMTLGALLRAIGHPADDGLPGRLVAAGVAEVRPDPTSRSRKLIRATRRGSETARSLATVDDDLHVARGALLAALDGQRHGQVVDAKALAKRLQSLLDERAGILRRHRRGWLEVTP